MLTKIDLDTLAVKAGQACEEHGWTKDWVRGGCYLHLESSEFVEALRGKHGDPVEEAGDVLFALLSMLDYYDIKPNEVLIRLEHKIDNLDEYLEQKRNDSGSRCS